MLGFAGAGVESAFALDDDEPESPDEDDEDDDEEPDDDEGPDDEPERLSVL